MAHRRLALSLILRLSCHLSEAVLSEVSAESKLMWRIQQALVTHLFFKFSCSLAFATSCHVSRHKTPPRSRAASASPLNLVRVVVALRLKRRIWVDFCTRQNLGIRIPFLRACHQKLRSALLRLAAIRITTKRRCLGQGADLPCHEATVPPAADDVLQLGSHNLTSLGMMNTLFLLAAATSLPGSHN